MVDQAGVTPGWYKATAKIAYEVAGHNLADWDALRNSKLEVDKKKVKKFG